METKKILPDGILRYFSSFYLRHAPDAVRDPYSSNHWKEKLLYMVVLVALPVGFFVFVLGMPGNIQNQYWIVSAAAILGYLACLFAFFRPDIHYKIRAFLACSVIYGLGLSLILDIGPFLGTREYLFFFSILASLLFGWAGAAISISINLLTCILVSVLIYFGFWKNLLHLDDALLSWHMIAIDLVFINISTTLLITLFFKRIETSDLSVKKYSQLLLKESEILADTNKKLEEEMDVRQTMTQALQASEEKYRTILETIKDAYFEMDLGGNFTFFNNALVNKLGYTETELTGMNYRAYMDKINAEKMSAVFDKIKISKQTAHAVEMEVNSKNNTLISINVLVSLLNNKAGELIGFQGLARDITEHKAMESRLRRAQKMEAVGTLAGGVAHDLNNTLFGVVGYPELLLMNMTETDPLRKPLLEIKKSGEKAVAIVQDLLTLARRNVAVKEVVNLNVIINEYLFSNEFKKLQSFHAGVNVIARLEKSLFNISGSPIHLSKTVMNLISNAAEAIEGGGEIIISTGNRYIEPTETQHGSIAEGDYVVLTVSDTGEGIDPDDMEKIFEPFFTKKVMGRSGTGLGMAVVWGTMQDHDGQIDVQSIKGKGTTFTLYFPITRQDAALPSPAALSIDHYKGAGQSVLIVDDVEVQREVASNMLGVLGYRVAAVESGEKAVEYLKSQPVDILLLDMIMQPGINGMETYGNILQFRPDQKAVIASGFSETDQVRATQKLGAGAYIRKPYSIETLGITIKKELER